MINHLIVSTLTALVALIVVRVLRGQSARLRHAILLIALLRFAVPTPWLTAVGSALVRCLPSHTSATPVDELAGLLRRAEAGAAKFAASPARPGVPWDRVIWGLWAVGTAVSLGVWARRWPRAMDAVLPASESEQAAFARATAALGLRAPVDLRIVSGDHVPAAVGWWRASVVLPAGFSADLGAEELYAVVAHELAHIRRRDNLLAALSRVIAAVFWFHPLEWWIEKQMLVERETACDELVLGRGVRAEDYAAAILKVCRAGYEGAVGYAGITGSNLQQRMEHIMTADLKRHSTRLRAVPGLLAAFAILVPLAGGFLHAQAPVARQSEADALDQSGLACLERKDYRQAEVEFRKLLALAPNDVRGVIGLTETYMAGNRMDDAIQFMQSQKDKFPSNSVYQMTLGNLLVRAQRFDEGIAHFAGLLDREPNNTDLLMRLGEAYRRKGDLNAAAEYFRRASQLDPNNPQAILQLALIMDGTGQREQARSLYEKLLTLQPDHPVALNNLAYIETETGGDLDRALARAERARQKMPESVDIADTVGTIYLKKRMAEPAIATFTWALGKDFDNAAFRAHLADALDLRSNLTGTEQELRALLHGGKSEASTQRIRELLR